MGVLRKIENQKRIAARAANSAKAPAERLAFSNFSDFSGDGFFHANSTQAANEGQTLAGLATLAVSNSVNPKTESAPASDPAALDERLAMAMEGGVHEVYADAWARLQIQRPVETEEATWRRAIDDAGVFLDQWGELAAQFGWTAGEIFDVPRNGQAGLIWILQGEAVRTLGPEQAIIVSDRIFDRLDRSAWASVADWVAARMPA